MPIWILLLWVALAQDSPKSRDAYLAEAKAYIAQGNFAKAAVILDLAVLDAKPDPGSEPYLALVDCRLKLDQKEQALEAAEHGIKRYPASGPLLKAAGAIILQESSSSERAGDLLERAAKALPQDPGAHYAYGLWALMNHREEIAIAEERSALALSPTDDLKVQALTFIGLGEDALKRPQRAEVAFRAALEVNRKLTNPNPSTELEFAMFLTRQSRQGEAKKLLDEILKFAPGFGPAHLERAKYLSAQGDLESALAEAKIALDQAGSDPKSLRAAHAFLARTCFALGRMDEAQVHERWIESH